MFAYISLLFTPVCYEDAHAKPCVIAPAPVSTPGHLTLPPKVSGHITATMESAQASVIPVATISGQQVSNTFYFTFNIFGLHIRAFFLIRCTVFCNSDLSHIT